MIEALLMPRALDAVKAEEVAKVVKKLGRRASFRSVWREAARAGILAHNKTLRTYLDLLVRGGVLSVRTRDVGSVYSQQVYTFKSKRPRVYVGLSVLQKYELNWDVPETDSRIILTDFSGLVRSKLSDQGLMASLEDCLVHEVYRDAKENTGTISLVVAMISTKKLDLPYLLKRADELHVGRPLRLLFNRMLEITSSNMTELDASVFLAVRVRFLNITRQYVRSGFWKLVAEEKGFGTLGLRIIERFGESEFVLAAAKQLGVTG